MPQARWIDLDGPMHYADHGGPEDAPLIVCVHGLGGSHANWSSLAPLLTDQYRVLAVDLAGFGLTVGGPRSSSVPANRRLLDRFLAEVAGQPVVLIGNSMGGLISAMEAAKNPAAVSHLVLIDPALPIPVSWPDPKVTALFGEMLLPRPARRAIARRRGPKTAEQIAADLLNLVCADPSRISPQVLQEHRELARQRVDDRHAARDFGIAAQSLGPFLGTGRRRFSAMLRTIEAPVLLLHGDRDRLINIRAARKAAAANPVWRFEVAEGVGHVPQLEAPQWTAHQIRSWLAAHPARVQLA
jgi:pimeloyl-ACP methyl ester carboxylesterase